MDKREKTIAVVAVIVGNAVGLVAGFFIYKSGFGNLIAFPFILVGMVAGFAYLVASKMR
jgi:uncharacterized membrane protein